METGAISARRTGSEQGMGEVEQRPEEVISHEGNRAIFAPPTPEAGDEGGGAASRRSPRTGETERFRSPHRKRAQEWGGGGDAAEGDVAGGGAW
ncbi:hypothetical protein NL676_034327 [Syzygium grande]|nr:hypothetical protein NL676_034327 [Syzygium grande]